MNKEESERSRVNRISWLIWGLLAAIVILLISAFVQAWDLHRALEEKETALVPLLELEEARQATLEAELTYVLSDEYAAAWSQERARMTQGEDEVLVIPLAPTLTPTPPPDPSPLLTPTPPVPFWRQWWERLTGN